MNTRTLPLTSELEELREEILQYALDYGLDFYPVCFEVCDYNTINVLAAQGGFPHRYPHWRFGMEYDQLSKSYTYGLSKIYEMVINTNPCYAYLLKANHWVDQKIVMAHVYGHADFFKNNAWFKNTDRDMMDVMANHRSKMRRYGERYGQDQVEFFIDQVLSLDNLLDVNVLFETQQARRSRWEKENQFKKQLVEDEHEGKTEHLKSFMRSSRLNSKEDKSASELEEPTPLNRPKGGSTPKDIMMFLMENAPLRDWQADVLGCLREEAYYFLPQRMTKIMNEGWASYWHSTIMTKKALKASEIVDFSDKHAGVMAMDRQNINPYKVGIELFRDIEHRWNREKIFEVRRTHNDVTFIDEFLTREFCERQQLFTYHYNPRMKRFEIEQREFDAIKAKLLASLTNFSSPVIEVDSGNFNNRGELHLIHKHQGVDLDMTYAADTLKNLYALWQRPVNLTSLQEGSEILLVCDGKEVRPA